jgi:hypothetical protein
LEGALGFLENLNCMKNRFAQMKFLVMSGAEGTPDVGCIWFEMSNEKLKREPGKRSGGRKKI